MKALFHYRDRRWEAEIPDVPGCHTYGETLLQARQNLREALACSLDDLGEAQAAEVARDAELEPTYAITVVKHSSVSQMSDMIEEDAAFLLTLVGDPVYGYIWEELQGVNYERQP